ncbi:concanavalin A-like lectin/glucanase domain-containing protein [Tribonema minus]|uniref:Concanavalin A-like lectin/glucanase domain-containing protein n=1 Tax=Tribonema minus TaxID=303371 RepID=A0A835Z4E8_9STRA|nr:concanavalin A-like lectin/glucanase domain-containing protein [Tribonema minus]
MRAALSGLAATALLALQQQVATAEPISTGTFASPFGSFDASGKRRVAGWRAGGTARVKMGAVSLTQPQADEKGSLWSLIPNKLGDAFSFEAKFRMSGANAREGGESIAWFLVADSLKVLTGDFFGIDKRFQGLAITISTDHPDAMGDASKDMQKVTLWANNNSPEPTELGSCLRPFYYDESRDDFMPSLASTLRASYDKGRLIVDVDPRNTQRWYRCLTSARVPQVLPDSATQWRERASFGVAARTGAKKSRFEVTALRLYSKPQDAAELALPDWNGDGGDRALKIAHQLEHGLFEVKDSIEAMLGKLAHKADADVRRIRELEEKLAHGALSLMEKRLGQVEARLTSLSTPIIDARVRQVEAVAQHRLNNLSRELGKGAGAWVRPFVVVLVLLFAFAGYSYREFRKLNKWNNTYM